MLNDLTLISLTKKLISLPSYVDKAQNEIPVTDFLVKLLETALPEMTITKQYVNNSRRYNLIVTGVSKPKLFVIGHVDTVQPKEGWKTNPLKPVVQQGRLLGLGAADMKGSLAAFLWALLSVKQTIATNELMLLLYVDEEYDFKGINCFLQDDAVCRINPRLTLSLDGALAVSAGCRGLIEISLRIKGRSGHSSNPKNGVNAITQTLLAYQKLEDELNGLNNPILGPTTSNLAYLQGGVTRTENVVPLWDGQGNVIPDTVDLVLEVRPSVQGIDGQFILGRFKKYLQDQKLKIEDPIIRHDIAPWANSPDKQSLEILRGAYRKAGVPFKVAKQLYTGYVDVEMVARKIATPTYVIGAGGFNRHGANEYVLINQLEQATCLYREILKEMLS
ncbi:MAG TPA: M20 family metallopeptidase [Candidatus Limnocylindrales bacterium]|nr:M20 family metallopeptidase [Candidatus Limnocylindrales bacterium]